MSGALVNARALTRTFRSGSKTFDAVVRATCVVEAHDRIAIVGPSGSGKSTLIHMLSGLDSPSVGFIEWSPQLGVLNSGSIAVVFQSPSLLDPLSVLYNVAFPLEVQGFPEELAIDAASRALGRLGLKSLSGQMPDELSGGQAQRVAVARALATGAQLIFADEPTGQLDHANALSVVTALLEAADESQAAVVIATHDNRVAEMFSAIWQMRDGHLSTCDAS